MQPRTRQPTRNPQPLRNRARRYAKGVASVPIAVVEIADGAMARTDALRAKVNAKVRVTGNPANRVVTVRRVPIVARALNHAPNHVLSALIAVRARSSKAARNARHVNQGSHANPVVNRGLQKRVLNPQPKPHSPACLRNSNVPNPAWTDRAKAAKNAGAAVVAVIVIAKDASHARDKTANAGNIGRMANGRLQQPSLSMMSPKRRWLLRPFL